MIRKPDSKDKRIFQLYLTDRATALMNFFVPIHNQYILKLVSVLDDREKELLISLLSKLKSGLELL